MNSPFSARGLRRFVPIAIGAASLVAFSAPQVATITLDSGTTFQTFDGWEASAQATQIDGPNYAVHASWPTDSPVLMDLLVNDLGITRLRLSVKSGAENPTDYYQQFKDRLIDRPNGFNSHRYDVVNDNNDPNVADPTKFHWTELDEIIDLLVTPFRAKVIASGQVPYIDLCYVDFDSVSASAFKHSDSPAEYAEFVLMAFQHIQSKYGWTPDGFEVILEGDIAERWESPIKIGNSLVAAAARLGAAGFHPEFIAPSSTSLLWAANNFDALVAVPGVAAALDVVAYHLYWNNADADLMSLASKAAARGMKTGMTELISADHVTLSNDLRKANVSVWQQFTMASYYLPDDGGKYYIHNGTTYVPADRTRYLRQYFRHIRPGAVRIGASSSNAALTPVAFINPGGKYSVVVNATGAQSFTVGDLPAGTYGIRYTTATATDVTPGNQTIGAGGLVSTSIPGAGALTVFNIPTQTGEPNVVQNGSFASGLAGWQTFATPDLSYLSANVTNGVLQFYRNPSPPGTTGQAVVLQQTGVPLAAGSPVSASFDVGNSSTVRKRISVLLHDQDFSDLSVCTFWLPANAPIRTYRMGAHTTEAWTGASISFYAATAGSDGGFYLLDNVSLADAPTESVDETTCVDPTTPIAPGGPAGGELLLNQSFDIGGLLSWALFGTINSRVNGGVLEFYRPPGDPAGAILQPTGQPMANGQIMTATFDLGNSSNVRKRVTVLLHDLDFSDLSACTFWLAPGQALAPYAMQAFATKAWTSATLSVYPSTVDTEPWTRLDNLSFKRTPGAAIVGTTCQEPGAVSLSASSGTTPASTAASGAPTEPTVMNWVTTGTFAPIGSETYAGSGLAWEATASVTQTNVLGQIQPFDLRQKSSAQLNFQSRLSSRGSKATVQVSTDGVGWQTILDVPPMDLWAAIDVDLTPFAGAIVYVRFVFDAIAPTGEFPVDAWAIRDVRLDAWSPGSTMSPSCPSPFPSAERLPDLSFVSFRRSPIAMD